MKPPTNPRLVEAYETYQALDATELEQRKAELQATVVQGSLELHLLRQLLEERKG